MRAYGTVWTLDTLLSFAILWGIVTSLPDYYDTTSCTQGASGLPFRVGLANLSTKKATGSTVAGTRSTEKRVNLLSQILLE